MIFRIAVAALVLMNAALLGFVVGFQMGSALQQPASLLHLEPVSVITSGIWV